MCATVSTDEQSKYSLHIVSLYLPLDTYVYNKRDFNKNVLIFITKNLMPLYTV